MRRVICTKQDTKSRFWKIPILSDRQVPIMKKAIPFAAPVIAGLLGGWLVEAMLCFCSILISPFAGAKESGFLTFCGVNALASLLIIAAVTVVNILHLTNSNSREKIRWTLSLQAVVVVVLGAASVCGSEQIYRTVSHLI